MRKKKNMDEEGNAGEQVGRVLTVSLFLILLTFFILLNSMAVIDDQRTRKAFGSLVGAFGSLTGGLSPLKTGDSIMPPSAPIVNEKFTIDDLLAFMDKETLENVQIMIHADKEIITIDEKFIFDRNKRRIKESAYPFLQRLCRVIKDGNYSVEITGHTDNLPAYEKGYRSSWELSSIMAVCVLRYFITKCNIAPELLLAYGCSYFRPVAPMTTRGSRALNNRIEIILNKKLSPYLRRIYKKRRKGIFVYKNFDFKIFQNKGIN